MTLPCSCRPRVRAVFVRLQDFQNAALLCCNLGKLERLRCAEDEGESTLDELETWQREVQSFKASQRHYERAREILLRTKPQVQQQQQHAHRAQQSRAGQVQEWVWEAVSQELARAKFSLACFLQDSPPKDPPPSVLEEIEKCIPALLQECLKYYEGEVERIDKDTRPEARGQGTSRPAAAAQGHDAAAADRLQRSFKLRVWIQERIGNIHHRLASFHHHLILRSDFTLKNAKQLRALAEHHYSKALVTYVAEEHPVEYLQIHLELARLWEVSAADKLSFKNLRNALLFLLAARRALPKRPRLSRAEAAHQQQGQLEKEKEKEKEKEEKEGEGGRPSLGSLAPILEAKTQNCLKELLRHYGAKKNPQKTEALKRMYGALLGRPPGEDGLRTSLERVAALLDELGLE